MKMRYLQFAVFLSIATAAFVGIADTLICSVCRQTIKGKYVRFPDGSVRCLKCLPKCAVCGKRVSGKHYRHKGKRYCSMKCFETILPKCELCSSPMKSWKKIQDHRFCQRCAKLPRCSECMLPMVKGKKYKDGRMVCPTCSKFVITDHDKAKAYYLRARRELEKVTGHKTAIIPELRLVSAHEIAKTVKNQLQYMPSGVVRGFYQRTETFEEGREDKPLKVTREILMLYGMRANNYVVTGVHEFTHDLISEKFARIKQAPAWVQEGICQYTAYVVARKYKLEKYYRAIELHPGEAYGDGFRYFVRNFGPDNWEDIETWIRTVDVDKIPAKAPKK